MTPEALEQLKAYVAEQPKVGAREAGPPEIILNEDCVIFGH